MLLISKVQEGIKINTVLAFKPPHQLKATKTENKMLRDNKVQCDPSDYCEKILHIYV